MRGIFGQWNLFCSKWDWSFTGLKWRWCILTGNTWSSFQLWLICRSSDRGHLSGSIFWGALQDLSERYGTITIQTFKWSFVFSLEDSLTLFGVWMGDRASRSVMGNSRPRLLRSSYTCTTPTREEELRNASAHDWRWKRACNRLQRDDWPLNLHPVAHRTTHKRQHAENRSVLS